MQKKIMLKGKKVGVLALVTMMLAGTVSSAATFGVSRYHYSNSKIYGIAAASSGFSSYVTTWCETKDDNSYHYNSERKKNASDADANVVWDKGSLKRSAGYYR